MTKTLFTKTHFAIIKKCILIKKIQYLPEISNKIKQKQLIAQIINLPCRHSLISGHPRK